MSEPQTEDTMIAGLLRERDGYRQRGMAERVALVDEQLALRGWTGPDPAAADPGPAGPPAPSVQPPVQPNGGPGDQAPTPPAEPPAGDGAGDGAGDQAQASAKPRGRRTPGRATA
ncbi:hypothetical protein [Acrocarpospora phusangensis]|nr:hypothetical protein [Acrocarpospora phusangensis]